MRCIIVGRQGCCVSSHQLTRLLIIAPAPCRRFVPVLGSELVRGKDEEALSREQRALVRLLPCSASEPSLLLSAMSRASSRLRRACGPARN